MVFTTEDIMRAFEIYGPSLGAVRGKTCKLKKSRSPQPIAEKAVDSRATMHIDLMFLSGVAFLVSYVKPIGLILCNLIKSKTVDDIRTAIEKQTGTLVSEGFKVVEITSDSESSIVAIQSELERSGCRVPIDPPGTDSAEQIPDLKCHKSNHSASISTTFLPTHVCSVLGRI
jgi:hypothetical protein